MIKFITSENKSTNVEEVMGYVNKYVNWDEMGEDEIPAYTTVHVYDIRQEYSNLLDLAASVAEYQMLSPDNPIMAQGKMIKVKIMVKTVLRKLMKWYMKDIIAQQMRFNESVVKCLNQELYIINQMDMEITRLRKTNGSRGNKI